LQVEEAVLDDVSKLHFVVGADGLEGDFFDLVGEDLIEVAQEGILGGGSVWLMLWGIF
jgi:hypothetical protein